MSPALTSFRNCSLCEANCGLSIGHDGARVLSIRGDPKDPFSRGHVCPKALGMLDVQDDPDRVRSPLRRDGASWKEVDWEEALEEIASRLAAIQREHGRDAVGFYYGNPTAHSYSALLFGMLFARHLGTKSVFSSNSVDGLPRMLVSTLLYGSQAVQPIPDLDRAGLVLLLGANPVVSNGSIMTAPDVARRLSELQARGGTLVVVDPRRSETAERADRHLFIRPGTDALLLAAMLQVIFESKLVNLGRATDMVHGFERLPELLAPFTPARVAPVVGIAKDAIEGLARDFARAGRALCYGRMGVCVQEFGAAATWLIDLLNIVTGRLDAEGGVMFPRPAIDLAAAARRLGQTGPFDRFRSRVSGLPEFNGELPSAAFAEEMDTPGPGQLRALVTHAGNPALSLANGPRVERALAGLELMVSLDVYLNETTRHAHFVLPTSFGFERDHFALLFWGLSIRNGAHYTRALLAKPEGTRHDWEILLELTARLLERRGGLHAIAGRAERALLKRLGPRGLLRVLLRLGGRGLTLDDLEREPHGLDLGPLEPRLPELLGSGKIRLAPERLVRDLERLRATLEPAAVPGPAGGLVLIGRRTLRSNNSWMHNCARLVKGADRCTLLMHPEDAKRLGLTSGERVAITSRVGRIEVPLKVSDEVMSGVVCLPHGWGHDRPGARLSVARAHAGASVNDLTDDRRIDPVSGTSALNGLPVTVERASG